MNNWKESAVNGKAGKELVENTINQKGLYIQRKKKKKRRRRRKSRRRG